MCSLLDQGVSPTNGNGRKIKMKGQSLIPSVVELMDLLSQSMGFQLMIKGSTGVSSIIVIRLFSQIQPTWHSVNISNE